MSEVVGFDDPYIDSSDPRLTSHEYGLLLLQSRLDRQQALVDAEIAATRTALESLNAILKRTPSGSSKISEMTESA